MSNLEMFRQEAIWDKVLPVGFLDSKRRLMRRHENIVMFSTAGYPTFNPQMTRRGKKRWKGGGASGEDEVYSAYGERKSYNNEYFPTTIIEVSNGDRTRKELVGHPTQKPVALYDYLIRTYTNHNDTVLDICMGSGTTGVAAIQLGRNFIGCEISPDYFKIAENRIKEAEMQPNLFITETPKATQEDLL
jgi:site-specific DNA-methyltransferase (adenine-specific)